MRRKYLDQGTGQKLLGISLMKWVPAWIEFWVDTVYLGIEKIEESRTARRMPDSFSTSILAWLVNIHITKNKVREPLSWFPHALPLWSKPHTRNMSYKAPRMKWMWEDSGIIENKF
jgi:hypothetical protein